MRYISTRGEAPALGFCDVMLTGLASDGGLYLPETWPTFSDQEIASFRGKDYADVAFAVTRAFAGDEFPDDWLRETCREAYASFAHPAVTPLVQLGPRDWLLELFHGPTLAFKDVAMQLLARLMDHELIRRDQRATLIVATSGDTGGAAVDAFAGRDRIDLFVLLPDGRVSDVQRRQMTTSSANNIHALAIDGTFDDAQALVKSLFNDADARQTLALSGVNSINWARVMAQSVYYFTAGVALGAPERAASYCVPTANFGDILAGYVAKRMGLPVERLVIATNANDILVRTLSAGRYEVTGVVPTQTPSMDIQISSNFERLMFEACNRDADLVRTLMASLKQSGTFTMPADMLAAIRAEFDAGRLSEAETTEWIGHALACTGELLDPHTAIGFGVALRQERSSDAPVITLATAHPAKFPDAVEAATGVRPALPDRVGDLYALEERVTPLPNDYDRVKQHIIETSRASRIAA